MNRTSTPKVNLLDQIPLKEAEIVALSPNIKAYLLKGGKKKVIKIQTFFNAGRWHEPQKLVAQITATMLKEGTKNYSAKALAEKIDFYGASIHTKASLDFACITASCMCKFLPQVMELICEIISQAIFPEKELHIILNNLKQKLAVHKEKTTYLATTHFHSLLFGESHPYGYKVKEADYNQLNVDLLQQFYQQKYTSSYPIVYISGSFNEGDVQYISDCYANLFQNNTNHPIQQAASFSNHQAQQKIVPKKDALQAAIRIGKPLVNKHHPDRFVLNILNVILGGYFGSRLMRNIREDKGYTYSIYATIASYLHADYFLISTEVANEVYNEALKEIYKEIDHLQNEPIAKEELQLVKNYISGSLLRLIDGPFKTADILKGLYDFGLDTRYFQAYVDKVKSVTANEIQQCAQQYLTKETFTQVVACKE